MDQDGAGAVAWEEEPTEIDATEIDDFLFKAVATEAEVEPILKHEKEAEIFGDSSGSDSFDEEAALKERERREAKKKRKTGKKRSRSSRGGGRSSSLHHDFSSSESSDGDDDDEDWEVEKKPKKGVEKEKERPKGRALQKKGSAVAKPPKKAKRVGGDPWAAAIHSSRAREDPHYMERPAYGQIGQQQTQQPWRRQAPEYGLQPGAPSHMRQAPPADRLPRRGPPPGVPPSYGHQGPTHGHAPMHSGRPGWQARPYEDGRGRGVPGQPPSGRPHQQQQPPAAPAAPLIQQSQHRPEPQPQAPPVRTPSNPTLAATLKELTESSKSSTSILAPPAGAGPDVEEARKSFKKYSSKIIVANVTKYNKEEALEKDAFKNMCRKLTHIVMEKEKKNNFVITHKTEAMLVKLVDSHMKAKFPKHKRVLRKAKR